MEPNPLHVLMVSFPSQGHINPLLRLAKCLASKGLLVTFSTTQQTGQMMKEATNKTDTVTNIGNGQLRFEFFSDGWDINEPKRVSLDALMHQLETASRDSFAQLLKEQAEQGRPVSCIINNSFVPWVTELATELGIPSAVLWDQSCAAYSIYYHYHHKLVSFPNPDQQDLTLDLPGLPTLDLKDIPSILTLKPFESIKKAILGQFKNLEKAFCVLVDSFEGLEYETISAMSQLSAPVRPVGPLFKSPNVDNNDNAGSNVRGDMWKAADDCLGWLDSQSPGSVVYVSFGSLVALTNEQMEELRLGLLKSGLPFLWVVKSPSKDMDGRPAELPEGFIEEAKGKGLVVQWCPQEQVLAHPSISCFITHCGWNSSMESLSLGVPVVAFPQYGDQVMNAKFLVDVYGVGLHMKKCTKEDQELVTSYEVERRIVEVTKGPKAEELKRSAMKWKAAAEEAVTEGGSSYRNIQSLVDDIRKMAS